MVAQRACVRGRAVIAAAVVAALSGTAFGAVPDPELRAHATAQYQNLGPNSNTDVSVFPTIPESVDATASAFPARGFGNTAFGQGAASVGVAQSAVQGFAFAGGSNPQFGPPDEVIASGDGCSRLLWCVTSDTLETGTQIFVEIDLRFSGILSVANFYGVPSSEHRAAASGRLEVDGMTLYSGSATLDSINSNASMVPPVLTPAGDWLAGDFTGFALNDSALIIVNTSVGAMFEILLKIETDARIPGPFEAESAADFLNGGKGGSYTLEGHLVTGAPAPVTFELCPTPGSTVLAGLVVLGFACRRRRD